MFLAKCFNFNVPTFWIGRDCIRLYRRLIVKLYFRGKPCEYLRKRSTTESNRSSFPVAMSIGSSPTYNEFAATEGSPMPSNCRQLREVHSSKRKIPYHISRQLWRKIADMKNTPNWSYPRERLTWTDAMLRMLMRRLVSIKTVIAWGSSVAITRVVLHVAWMSKRVMRSN